MNPDPKSAAIRRGRVAVLATLMVAGCAGLQTMLNPSPPAPIAQATASPLAPSPLETPRVVHRRRRRRAPIAAKVPVPSPSPAVANAPAAATPAPSSTPAVMLVGTDPGPGATQSVIDSAAKSLARVDRSKLTAPNAAAYDQARGMIASALAAKRRGDDLTATGFAKKAAALARSLPGAP
jgi:hypothetical protein